LLTLAEIRIPVQSSALLVTYFASDNCARNGSSDSHGVHCNSLLHYSAVRASCSCTTIQIL